MKTLAITFWGGELVAALAFLLGAAIQIESILVIGPILAIIGLLLGLLSSRLQSGHLLVFALSGPFMTAVLALMIALFELGPQEAQTPVVAVFSAYVLASLPLAGFTLKQAYRWESTSATLAAPWRFSLKTLLIVMTGACLIAAVFKLMADAMDLGDFPIFAGYAVALLTLCAVVVWRFVATRRQANLLESNSGDNRQSPPAPV